MSPELALPVFAKDKQPAPGDASTVLFHCCLYLA